MRSIYFFISFATPILGIINPLDIIKLKDALPELLVAMLGEAGNAWENVPCNTPSLESKFNDPTEQWNDAKATEGFLFAYKHYKDNNHEEKGFTNSLLDYFHANPLVNCKNPTDVGCSVGTECKESNAQGAGVVPAGYMIINSIAFLHRFHQNQFIGISEALNTIQSEIGTFTGIFSPQVDPMKDEKILIDILLMGFGIFSGGVFNSWLKKLKYFDKNKNELGVLKDTTNSWVTQGMNIIKDSKSAISELKVQNTLELLLKQVVTEWQSATNKTLAHFMSDDPLGLLNLMVDGKLWDPAPDINIENTKAEIRKTLYSVITPYAWSLANSNNVPFIATSEGIEGSPGDCASYDAENKYKEKFVNSDLLYSNRICIENGQAVWLLSILKNDKDPEYCRNNDFLESGSSCQYTRLEQLPGFDSIKEEKDWGFTRDQLASAAVRGWEKNGRVNGKKGLDYTTQEGRDEILDHGISAMGYVNIPICSFEEVLNNAKKKEKSDNWPCN